MRLAALEQAIPITCASFGIRYRIPKIIRVAAVGNINNQRSRNALEFAGPGTRNDDDRHFLPTCIHSGQLLKCKAAMLSLHRTGYDPDSYVAGDSLLRVPAREHFPLRCRL